MSEAENTLSIWSLIAEASFVVQLVMLILFLASMVSWVMIFQRGMYQRKAHNAFLAFEKQFADLAFTTSCCHRLTSLNDLTYRMPAGFSKFVVTINEAEMQLSEAHLASLEELFGTSLKVVWARY